MCLQKWELLPRGIHGPPRNRKIVLLLLCGGRGQEPAWFLSEPGGAGNGRHLSGAQLLLDTVLRICVGSLLLPFTHEEMEAQTGGLTSSWAHSWMSGDGRSGAPTVWLQSLDSTHKHILWDKKPGRQEEVGDSGMLAGTLERYTEPASQSGHLLWDTQSSRGTQRYMERKVEIGRHLETPFYSSPKSNSVSEELLPGLSPFQGICWPENHLPHFYPKTLFFCIFRHPRNECNSLQITSVRHCNFINPCNITVLPF